MQFKRIKINSWRRFSNIEIKVSSNSKAICLVGANGSGKSHILHLIASCAQALGLSQGIANQKKNVFGHNHSIECEFLIDSAFLNEIDFELSKIETYSKWNRRLLILSERSENKAETDVFALGLENSEQSKFLGKKIVESIRKLKTVNFLMLDADRSFPSKSVNQHDIGRLIQTDWQAVEYTRDRSYRPSGFLYDEWIGYLLSIDNQKNAEFVEKTRLSQQSEDSPPVFDDHFGAFRTSIKRIFRDLDFVRINQNTGVAEFSSFGNIIPFDEMSGGEREIIFQLGQIDRFNLKNGLFLVDEPELHLNADLMRTWVEYLSSSFETGQLWLATHSMEVVEAVGVGNCVQLELNQDKARVENVSTLSERPAFTSIARALGTPAFSISNLRFVFVEGETHLRERDRFRKLIFSDGNIRFIEGGSSDQVKKRVKETKDLAAEADEKINVCGIIDRDFKNLFNNELEVVDNGSVFVLPVLEIENLFLEPSILDEILRRNGNHDLEPLDLVRSVSDNIAGQWIFQYCFANGINKYLGKPEGIVKDRVKKIGFSEIKKDQDRFLEIMLSAISDANDRPLAKRIGEIGIKKYDKIRNQEDFWKYCEGKEVMANLSAQIGYINIRYFENIYVDILKEKTKLPESIRRLRKFIED